MALNLESLRGDIADALDQVGSMALRTRDAMLHFYKTWAADQSLGPPLKLGGSSRPDELLVFQDALVQAGRPLRNLAAVARAEADFSAVFQQYAAGDFQGTAVATFRVDIERIYAVLAAALDKADEWLRAWAAEPAEVATTGVDAKVRRPDLAVLDQLTTLATEDVARALGISPAVARRRMSKGNFGTVTKVGKRIFVQATGVRAALRA